jgi:hypothetical protein
MFLVMPEAQNRVIFADAAAAATGRSEAGPLGGFESVLGTMMGICATHNETSFVLVNNYISICLY